VAAWPVVVEELNALVCPLGPSRAVSTLTPSLLGSEAVLLFPLRKRRKPASGTCPPQTTSGLGFPSSSALQAPAGTAGDTFSWVLSVWGSKFGCLSDCRGQGVMCFSRKMSLGSGKLPGPPHLWKTPQVWGAW
jgi:hypothetical protein